LLAISRMAHIRKMLVPMDGSTPSMAALSEAVALAEDLDASVEVLHVSAPDEFAVGSETEVAPGARAQDDREMEEAIAHANERLGDRLTRRTVAGEPIHQILEVAAADQVDLIVMGTHGRVGRLQELAGSLAAAVIRNSPCPVLTVRRPGGEEESFSERIHGRPTIAEQSRPPR
jgi:nucleotide-binding universal stress UspA family protein